VNEMGRYLVSGHRAYRGHMPGTEFEAVLDSAAEARAVRRGSIELLERMVADLPPNYRLPSGWPTNKGRKG
jgi:hypothetical protein